MSLSALCKACVYYNHADKTCSRSGVAVSKGIVHHDYAKFVRLDQKRCGPAGKWFKGTEGQTPVEELFESIDI